MFNVATDSITAKPYILQILVANVFRNNRGPNMYQIYAGCVDFFSGELNLLFLISPKLQGI